MVREKNEKRKIYEVRGLVTRRNSSYLIRAWEYRLVIRDVCLLS